MRRAALIAALASGCYFSPDEVARAELTAREGSAGAGSAVFQYMLDTHSNNFELAVAGAAPGRYAVHVHEQGDCSGDTVHRLGELEVGAEGAGSLRARAHSAWTVEPSGAGANIVGKSIVLHRGDDDPAPIAACGLVFYAD